MGNKPEQSEDEIEIAALAFRYLDRRLPDAQRTTLNDRLRTDDTARSTFVRCLLQAIELEELLPGELAVGAPPVADDELDKADGGDCHAEPQVRPYTTKTAGQGSLRASKLSFLNEFFANESVRIRSPFFIASLIA